MFNYISNDFYSDMLSELKHKAEKVEFILEHFPETRNNDNALCVVYWRLVDKIKNIEDIQFATKAEVIRRARQKIQNEKGKFLPTDEKILKRRGIEAEKMRHGIHTI